MVNGLAGFEAASKGFLAAMDSTGSFWADCSLPASSRFDFLPRLQAGRLPHSAFEFSHTSPTARAAL